MHLTSKKGRMKESEEKGIKRQLVPSPQGAEKEEALMGLGRRAVTLCRGFGVG